MVSIAKKSYLIDLIQFCADYISDFSEYNGVAPDAKVAFQDIGDENGDLGGLIIVIIYR